MPSGKNTICDAAARALLNAMAADPEFDAVKLETYWRSIQNETLKACAAAHRIARRTNARRIAPRAAPTRAASRRIATRAVSPRRLLVTSSGGVTLRTYAGLGSESDDGSDVALPAPLVATVVSQANKMRIGKLETLVSMFDKCCLVIISAPPFAATIVASEQADVAAILALRPQLASALVEERR